MSIIKSIKQQLGLGGTASEQHFWDGSVANQLTLKRGTPDAPGTELLKFLNGVLSFPNQGQSLTPNGYIKLPGGVIIQWGASAGSAGGITTIGFPTPFPNACLVANAIILGPSAGYGFISVDTPNQTNLQVTTRTAAGALTQLGFYYIAIGH